MGESYQIGENFSALRVYHHYQSLLTCARVILDNVMESESAQVFAYGLGKLGRMVLRQLSSVFFLLAHSRQSNV